jgi:hypothetical protein
VWIETESFSLAAGPICPRWLLLRDYPKSLGRAYNVALRAPKRYFSARFGASFGLRMPAKSTLGALRLPVFGQFLSAIR